MNNKDLLKILLNKEGQYLNSFYYALMLYYLYKNNKGLIMDYVIRVIDKELSTLQMLTELGIYHSSNHELFDTELEFIKKSL